LYFSARSGAAALTRLAALDETPLMLHIY